MRAGWLVAIAVTAACGDDGRVQVDAPAAVDSPDVAGPPLAAAAELAVVAHPADDLLLLSPALSAAVQSGAGTTIVYVTARAGERPEDRRAGLQAAYSAFGAAGDWACGRIAVGPISVEHCRRAAAKLSLVFLDYPDGGADGAAATSLLHLWDGTTTSVTAIGGAATFNQRSLIQLVTDIVDATAPTTIRTLEVASTHGADHSDHMLVGALTLLATARAAHDAALIAYRGSNIATEPANVDAAAADRATTALASYVDHCGGACAPEALAPSTASWLARSYPVTIHATATGKLQLGTSCINATSAGANAVLGGCDAAPAWQLDAHGTLRSAATDLCLEVFLTGEIIANTCGTPGPGARFFFDQEGRLWSGVVPPAQDDMALAHLDCVGAAGGRPIARLCGEGRAPVWQFTP